MSDFTHPRRPKTVSRPRVCGGRRRTYIKGASMMRNRWIAAAALALALLSLLRAPRPVSSAAAGPDPGLPGNVLIADAGNNRVIEENPEKRIGWDIPQTGTLGTGTDIGELSGA